MIVFGGKNAENDVLFNDIYFLGIPYVQPFHVLTDANLSYYLVIIQYF